MNEAASGPVLRFAGHELDVARGCLRGPDGAEVPLPPKPFDLLVALARNAGRTMSKEALLDAVWPGVHVTEDSLFQAVRDVRRAIGDEAGQVLRSVPRRGYRLDAQVSTDVPAAPQVQAPAPPLDRPSVVVLPFRNIGGGPEQDYLAEGIAEELTAALSRFRSLFVISRNSAAAFKGASVDVHEVGRALGVRYVVQGSVRQAGGRLRISAELVEAASQAQLWSDRFEGAEEDLFALQDRMVAAIAPVLEPAIVQAEIARAGRKPTADLTAYDLYLRALPKYHTWAGAEMGEARDLLEAALRQDAQFHLARALLAYVIFYLALTGHDPDLDRAWARALELVQQVLAEDTHDPLTVVYCAAVLFYVGHADAQALPLFDWAIAANPNCYEAWVFGGWYVMLAGDPDLALARFAEARRLDPVPANPVALVGQAAALFDAGRYAEAVAAAREAVARQPRSPIARTRLTVALALLGDIEAAKREAVTLLRLRPGLTLRSVERVRGTRDDARWALYVEGLRRAGVPEE
ncbi:winged helix-turn-helix domain-containing protein [Elioraea sp.]|uniref:winged helix-turn-helix domain-containing protein n=1 Tax=Elioraea sp. TaxID=2185103 RepID=UPI003F713743